MAEENQTADELQAGQFTPPEATANLLTEVTEKADLDEAKPPALPTGTTIPFQEQQVRQEELFTPTKIAAPLTEPVKEASVTGLELPTPPRTAAATYQSFVSEDTPEFAAAQGQVSAQSLIGDIEGAVSEESIAKSFEEGKPPPAWAAPAVRQVGGMMAQRGLGRSSMAAAAISQAIMESGIPIAQQDANKYATIQLQNLNNQQQATLQNAATYAAMDRANLSSAMQAAVNNARSFLQMDTQNLTNEQQLKTIDLQSKFQKLFTDQAQENAARQFNAKSQLQVDQFFTELETQVANANASRMAAMEQFNADQTNAAARYFTKINDARERFNISNENVIQQSNAVWRRNINTANTAGQNETNRINALNLLGINQASLDKLWQRYRDEAQWMVEISENAAQRAHNAAILSQTQDFNSQQYEVERESQFFSALGSTVINGVFGLLGA